MRVTAGHRGSFVPLQIVISPVLGQGPIPHTVIAQERFIMPLRWTNGARGIFQIDGFLAFSPFGKISLHLSLSGSEIRFIKL